MFKRDWGRIGPIFVRAYHGHDEHYENLTEAVRDVGLFAVERLKYGYLRHYTSEGLWAFYRFQGDDFVFYDELGLQIPLWKVQECANSLPASTWKPRHSSRRFQALPDWAFRRGPVPGVRRRRRRYGRCFLRRPKTTQEKRENLFFDLDKDFRELKLRSRARRQALPSYWDDLYRHREKNWKRQRRTQYKD